MKLVCLEGKEKDRVWELMSGRTIIGRDPSCDIIIKDPELSRKHAEIVREDEVFMFCDKNSLNGSYINRDRVTRQVIVPGDQIEMGETKVQVLDEDFTPDIKWQEKFIIRFICGSLDSSLGLHVIQAICWLPSAP